MPNPTWPESLPNPLIDACRYSATDDHILRSQFVGGQKVRRRYSRAVELLSFDLHLTRAQAQTLYDFCVVTLGDVGQFDWIEHRDPALGTATYRFRRRPDFEPARSGIEWRARVQLELLTPFSGVFALGDDEGSDLTTDDDEILTT